MEADTLPPGEWHRPEGSRIPGLPHSRQSLVQRALLQMTRRQAKSESNLNVFTVLARLGGIFLPYLLFLSQILMKGRISRADKEHIILRVAWRVGCVYEWGHHVRLARDVGLTEAEILSMAAVDDPAWDRRLRALLRATDELVEQRCLSEEAWEALREYLSEDQAVEFCMLVGHYVMVAGTINTLGVSLEPGYLKGLP